MLAPAGGFPSPLAVGNSLYRYRLLKARPTVHTEEQLCAVLRNTFNSASVFLTNSGKSALTAVLSAHRRRTKKPHCIVSAYTCPDVAVAVIRAGFTVVLADVDPGTLQLRRESIPSELFESSAGVVLSNLYGLPDSLNPWRRLDQDGFFIIDDACQSFQSSEEGTRIGLRSGTTGVLSFGRGKAVCGIGGGAVISGALRSGGVDAGVFSAPERSLVSKRMDDLWELLLSAGAWMLERPSLYALPSLLPGLKLGETHVPLDFPCSRISFGQSLIALTALGSFSKDVAIRESHSSELEVLLQGIQGVGIPSLERKRSSNSGISLLRFPIVFANAEQRERALRALKTEGLGANASYPGTLESYSELQEKVFFGDLSGAHSVASGILTLPLHRYVTSADRQRMRNLIAEAVL